VILCLPHELMMISTQFLFRAFVCCTFLTSLCAAQTAGVGAPAKTGAPKTPVKNKAPVKSVPAVPAASAEQVEAAQNVYYGPHECELNQSLDVAASATFPAYVDLKFGKHTWLMKPVLSTTGAIRLEHTKGETVLVQIATKSMLLNLKTGRRMVDECIGAKQREAIEVAKRAAAQAASVAAQPQATPAADAASAPTAASAPAAAEPTPPPASAPAAAQPLLLPLPAPASSPSRSP
jgi:hypothetical protein